MSLLYFDLRRSARHSSITPKRAASRTNRGQKTSLNFGRASVTRGRAVRRHRCRVRARCRGCRAVAGFRSRRALRQGMLGGMADVTQILAAIEHGSPRAAEQLLPLVYDELRKLAAVRLAEEKPGQTLQATAL